MLDEAGGAQAAADCGGRPELDALVPGVAVRPLHQQDEARVTLRPGGVARGGLRFGLQHLMVSMQGGRFVPVPFSGMIDPRTGPTRVRLVDIRSDRYAIARRYMIRLRRDDFEDAALLAKMAATAGLAPGDFRE